MRFIHQTVRLIGFVLAAGCAGTDGPTEDAQSSVDAGGAGTSEPRVEDPVNEDVGEGRPRSMTFEECRQVGGETVLDPGNGRTYVEGCAAGRTLLGWLDSCAGAACGEGGICCERPPSMTFAECGEAGGEVILDPGSGTTYTEGCPSGDLIGLLDSCTGDDCGEGGICCRE